MNYLRFSCMMGKYITRSNALSRSIFSKKHTEFTDVCAFSDSKII